MTPERVMIALLCATVIARELCYRRDNRRAEKLAKGMLEDLDACAEQIIALDARLEELERPKQRAHEIAEY